MTRSFENLAAVAFVLTVVFGSACTPLPKVDVQQPTTARAAPTMRPVNASGGIYQPVAYRPLFEDARPRYVGDILTININENLNASQAQNSNVSKTGSIATDPLNVQLPIGIFQGLNGIGVSGGSTNKFEGKGATSSNNLFTGTITVTVVDVLQNGYLVVSGEKQIGTNREVQTVRFSGVVNPVSILTGNVVSSAQVADARLEMRGQGAVDEAQMMGWLARFFLTFLPF
jgi:flagellar L-ring protein FlgH